MRLWTKLLLLGFLILLINSAYLISFGEPTLFYIGNVLIHVVLGVALIVPFIVYVHKHFARMSIIGKGGMVFLGVGVISGVYLMFVGATTPNRWLLILHIATVTLGAILFVGHLLIWAKRVETEIFAQSSANRRDCFPHQLAVSRWGKANPTLSTQPRLPREKPVLSPDQHV